MGRWDAYRIRVLDYNRVLSSLSGSGTVSERFRNTFPFPFCSLFLAAGRRPASRPSFPFPFRSHFDFLYFPLNYTAGQTTLQCVPMPGIVCA